MKVDNSLLIKSKSAIKTLKQKLNQKINKIHNDINFQLQVVIQAVINDRNDKVGVIWAQFFQENKALTHYIYKQYNAIWKKVKLVIEIIDNKQ